MPQTGDNTRYSGTHAPSAGSEAGAGVEVLDPQAIRGDFPILGRRVHGDRELVYLDNAATTQKPTAVIAALRDYYEQHNANVHRGLHTLSEEATQAYEGARARVARFLNASSEREVVFTRGTSEAINLVAQSWGRANLGPGDEVLITQMEHHSNIVPWQMVAEQTGAVVRAVPMDERGQLDLEAYGELLNERTKLVSVVHVSNALGTVNPVKEMVERAKAVGGGGGDVKVLVDGAQALPHLGMDVRALGCDFVAFSGHKVYGPTGLGALWGRLELLEAMPAWQGGGEMIKEVKLEGSVYADPPYRFEAGTPHIAGAVGLAAALDYVQGVGLERIAAWETELLDYGTRALKQVEGLRLIGTAEHKAAVLSFVLDYAHPLDAGTILDRQGVAVRTGHHCAQPAMEHFGVPATIRASLGAYNTKQEIDALVAGLEKVREFV